MKSSGLISFFVSILALALLALSWWLMRTSPEALAERARAVALSGDHTTAPAALQAAATVDAWIVRARPSRSVVEVSGVLTPARAVAVGAEVAGKVIEVAVEEHSVVAEGALLVRLDPAFAEAALARARAALQLAGATLRQARSELRRQRDLAARGIVSEVELERVETEESRSLADVAQARAQVLDAQTRLDKTRIVAPFSAVVTRLDLEPGAYLMPGQSVSELADIQQIELEVGVGDRDVGALREGQSVAVRVDALPNETFAGTIHKVASSPERDTRRYAIPVRLANDTGRLLPGMLASAAFEIGDATQVLRVPRRAIQREFDLEYVFEITSAEAGDGEALGDVKRRRVKTRRVAFRPDWIDIAAGLNGGERIAVTGVGDLRDGMRVRFRQREVEL